MASYYTFMIINLDEVKEPPISDGQYDFTSHSSIERVSLAKIENRISNYAASEVIDLFLESDILDLTKKETYKLFFGNLYWFGDDEFKGSNMYRKDAWGLRGASDSADFYSIDVPSLKIVISLESQIDYTLIMIYFERLEKVRRNFQLSFNEFFEVTQDWLTIYKLAVIKNKGVVFDIG